MRGRYAPSPTGDVHLGNASTALLGWLDARAAGGSWVMRIEDLDGPRVRPGCEDRILDDLRWLGLDWDEGPDVGGPHAPYRQSRRSEAYDAAFETLVDRDRVYPCFCSRRDIAAAASAPQQPGDELRYPGTCRALEPGETRRRIERGDRHAWRFRVSDAHAPAFVDRIHGARGGPASEAPGDFVVRRSDGTASYQLAVVVDDAAMEVDVVVRGDDLLASTERQLLLIRALGFANPSYAHVPLVLGPDGVRLSKRHRGTSIAELRALGWSPDRAIAWLARLHGLTDRDEIAAEALVAGFTWDRVRGAPGGIVIDPPT